MNTRWTRVARAVVASTAATLVAALSHVMAGSAAPGVAAIALSLAFSTLLCIALSGIALSLLRTISSVIASQLIFHGLFSWLGQPVPGSSMTSAPHHSPLFADASSPMVASLTNSETPLMWLSHAVAAAATIVAVRYGFIAARALETALGLLVGVVVAWSRNIDVCPVRVTAAASASAAPEHSQRGVVFAAMRHRGPPVPVAG